MHVDAGVGVEEIEAFASRAFLVAVVLLVAVSVGVFGGAAAVVVAGVAGEYCGEVALEQGSERRRAGAHDAEIEFDGGPDEEVEADPAGVGHPFDLVKVRMQTAEKGVYTGAMDVVRKTIAKEGMARVSFTFDWEGNCLRAALLTM